MGWSFPGGGHGWRPGHALETGRERAWKPPAPDTVVIAISETSKTMRQLRCAWFGAGRTGELLLEAVLAEPLLDVVALGEFEPPLPHPVGERLGVPVFRDARVLVVETAPDVLAVGLPVDQVGPVLGSACERGVAVFQTTPWAANLETAAAHVQAFVAADRPYALACPWGNEPAYAALWAEPSVLGRVYAAEVQVHAGTEAPAGSDGATGSSPCGLLRQEAYPPLDLLHHCCGLPEQVQAVPAWSRPRRRQHPGQAEDALMMVCRYGEGRAAGLTAHRTEAEPRWQITLCGTLGTMQVSDTSWQLLSPTGPPTETRRVRTAQPHRAGLRAFAEQVAAGETPGPAAAQAHLPTLAIIESAYLSAKTGHPESPAHLLDMVGRGAVAEPPRLPHSP